MALSGLDTMLASRVCRTSPRPWGITSAVAASARTRFCGNSMLVMTDRVAAIKVVSM